jgi:hypothetical protein
MKRGIRSSYGLALAVVFATAGVLCAAAGFSDLWLLQKAPQPPIRPIYRIATFETKLKDPEGLAPALKDFDQVVAASLDGRAYYVNPKTDPDQDCLKDGQKVKNCEKLQVDWAEDTRAITLVVEESAGQRGRIDEEYFCAKRVTLEQCVERAWPTLAPAIPKHDRLCHQGTPCIVKNGEFQSK